MDNNNKRTSRNRYKKKKHKKIWIIFTIFIVLALVAASIGGYTFMELNKIQTENISKSPEDLGIDKETEQMIDQQDPNNDVINIALFGLDRRSKDEGSRSDALMIASIDKKSKKIKLSSIMRDTYVAVPGHGNRKITEAYAFGGAQTTIKTLNQNFKLNIKDYVAVDFFGLEKIIDALGGVTIDVKQSEIKYINGYMSEVAGIEGSKIKPVTKAGSQSLNGMQAVAYSRIRYVGNDYERTARQRRVLTAMLNKIQSAGLTKYPSIVTKMLPYVETSISKGSMLSIGTEVLTSGTKTIDQERFPVDGYLKGTTINGASVIQADMPATIDQLHKYIFEDIKPQPKK